MGKATQDLMNEHEAILHVLSIADRALSSDHFPAEKVLNFGRELVYFLKIFADTCHHGKEEKIYFKALEEHGLPAQGGPVGVMLHEHELGRNLIKQMEAAVEQSDLDAFKTNATAYADLLRNHIAKENNVLFIMGDRVLSDELQNSLWQQFEAHEETVIGQGVHDKLHAMIDVWDKDFSLR